MLHGGLRRAREVAARDDGFVTQLLRVAHADLNDVASILNAYRSDHGSIVVYPRYEMAYEADQMQFIVDGVKTAEKKVDVEGLPVLAIGYSRGGAIAVEYAAAAARNGVPPPDWIMSVFPAPYGNQKQLIDLGQVPHFTQLVILVGDHDEIVGTAGAVLLGRRLQRGGFPGENIQVEQIVSHGSFNANHFAPMDTSKAAQAAFWAPADRILDEIDTQ